MKFPPVFWLATAFLTTVSGNAAVSIPFTDPFPTPAHWGDSVEKPVLTESFETMPSGETVAGVLENGWKSEGPVNLPTPPELRGAKSAMTIEFWAKGGALSGFLKGPGFSVNGQINMGPNGSHMVGFTLAKNGVFVGHGVAVIPLKPGDEQWHHYAVTIDCRYISSYVDGEMIERRWLTNGADQIGPMSDDTNVVENPELVLNPPAPVDELRIYDRALSPMQVRQNFENYRVASTVLYVAPAAKGKADGSDVNNAMPLSTALAKLGPETKLILKAGTYDGAQFQIKDRSGESVRQAALILGEPGAAPVIIRTAAGATGPSINGGGWVTLRHLKFVNESRSVPQALAVDSVPGSVFFDACEFVSVTSGLVVKGSPQVTVQNSVVQVAQTGIEFSGSPNAIVRNNTIQGGVIGLSFGANSGSIHLLQNLLEGQTGKAWVLDASSSARPFADNNAYAPATGGLVATVDGTDFAPVDFAAYQEKFFNLGGGAGGNAGGVSRAPELHSFVAEPAFVNPAAGDLRLKPESGNVIDSGTAASLTDSGSTGVDPALWDATGAARPLPYPLDQTTATGGNAADVGAYETAGPIQFKFNLKTAKSASAGVYNSAGQLIRTLFSGRKLPAGDQIAYWNGLDDQRASAPAGDYTIRVLANNVSYVWEGAIGNNSVPANGPTALRLFFSAPCGMAVAPGATAIYLALGYQEAFKPIWRMKTSDPNQIEARMGFDAGTNSKVITDVATDGVRAYFASSMGASESQPCAGFITAFNVADNSHVADESWESIKGTPYHGVLVGNPGANQEIAIPGVAVQYQGDLLFASVRGDNRVYLFDKTSGKKQEIEISVPTPGDLAVTETGDLWVVSGTTLQRFSAKNGWKSPIQKIEKLAEPIALAWTPFTYGAAGKGGSLLVADGGSSQQIKAFGNDSGAPLWTVGQAGGYANGIEVTTDKFEFGNYDGSGELMAATFLAVLPDGGFWIYDYATQRALKFGPDRTVQEKDTLSAKNSFYASSADANDPSRVFATFQEYRVDYSKPFGVDNGSWTPVRYWGHKLSAKNHGFAAGLINVTTLSNGRTYALSSALQEFVELTPQGLRETGFNTTNRETGTPWQLQTDGSLTTTAPTAPISSFYKRDLTGFDESGNPQWGDSHKLAEAPFRSSVLYTDPVYVEVREEAESGQLLTYNGGTNGGYHLGGIANGGSDWLWRAAPGARLDGRGSWDSSGQFAGANQLAGVIDGNLFVVYRGEFWQNVQANQLMQYSTGGLFIGQWGVASNLGHSDGSVPGQASNMMNVTAVKKDGKIYVYANDESSNSGIGAYRVDGLETLEEIQGKLSIGSNKP